MPFDVVEADLASGALMLLDIEGNPSAHTMTMSAVYPTDSSPGPAGRWMIERLRAIAGEPI
jgi:DNA-binding transcriptional LysR family regulator